MKWPLHFWLQAYRERLVLEEEVSSVCPFVRLSVATLHSFNHNNERAKPALLCGAERSSALRNGGGFGDNVVAVTMKKRLTVLLLTALHTPSLTSRDATSVADTGTLLQKRLKNQSLTLS